ncbi:MAG: hypothetical protein GF350_15460, partial [Chitinivibrionales bacterium]|nr:hypothetical protein [Chitinivibrionales bacterium]
MLSSAVPQQRVSFPPRHDTSELTFGAPVIREPLSKSRAAGIALGTAGEWYFSIADTMLYLRTTDSSSPENKNIEWTVYHTGVLIDNQSFVRIENLTIAYHYEYGVDLQGNSSHIELFNNDIVNVNGIGIRAGGNTENRIEGNTVADSNYYSMEIRSDNSAVYNNIIRRIGIEPRLGRDGLRGMLQSTRPSARRECGYGAVGTTSTDIGRDDHPVPSRIRLSDRNKSRNRHKGEIDCRSNCQLFHHHKKLRIMSGMKDEKKCLSGSRPVLRRRRCDTLNNAAVNFNGFAVRLPPAGAARENEIHHCMRRGAKIEIIA